MVAFVPNVADTNYQVRRELALYLEVPHCHGRIMGKWHVSLEALTGTDCLEINGLWIHNRRQIGSGNARRENERGGNPQGIKSLASGILRVQPGTAVGAVPGRLRWPL